jgi:hypothetical protein
MLGNVVSALALILLVSLAATRTANGQADSARAGAMTTNSIDVTATVIESSDPQIHGMNAEGAKNATYQAAYRSCMRRKGF